MKNTMKQWLWAVNSSGLGLYLIGLAGLGGMSLMAERATADQPRTSVIVPVDTALQQAPGNPVQRKPSAPAERVSTDGPWTSHLRRVDVALAQKDVSTAEQAWHQAYGEALGSRSWKGMIDVGDASLRIGRVANGAQTSVAKSRRLYTIALFRARAQGSLDGVLRTAEAYAALGDQEVVAVCIRIADSMADAQGDPQARDRVSAFAGRWVARSMGGMTSAFGP